MGYAIDKLIFGPDDVDLSRSPLAGALDVETHVLGAFNPGLARLPNGNLMMMVRVAEALSEPMRDGHIHAIRWSGDDASPYVLDAWPLDFVDTADPRKFILRGGGWRTMALTSLSWLLPIELSSDGLSLVDVHYDRIIAPAGSFQCYGVEDARISRIGCGNKLRLPPMVMSLGLSRRASSRRAVTSTVKLIGSTGAGCVTTP